MLFFFRSLLIIDLLLFVAKGLFRFSTSLCVNFGRLCHSRNWLISSSAAAAAAKSLQSCPTLCDPMDCSLPGFSVHGILQARTLERVAISFPNAWEWKVKVKSLSHVRLFAIPWTAAHQAPPSIGFSGQQYWSRVPLPSSWYHLGYQICGCRGWRFPSVITSMSMRSIVMALFHFWY